VIDSGSFVDLRPGTLTVTENPFDVALDGSGWLSYRAENGQTAYGRDGRFLIDGGGTLVTVTGSQVLDIGGAPINIPPDAGAIEIAADGTLSTAAGVTLAQIGVFDLPAIQNFRTSGGRALRAARRSRRRRRASRRYERRAGRVGGVQRAADRRDDAADGHPEGV
jgi:flagellar basal-body rod protein FlgF